jgi:hypothetical protein
MRPSRLAILGVAGLVALHVFMLAGHGRSHDAPMGVQVMAQHASPSPSLSPSLSTSMPGDADDAGVDMTVACLAVLAGLLLLLPARKGQPATVEADRPAAIGRLTRREPAGLRTRSLAELCISLT